MKTNEGMLAEVAELLDGLDVVFLGGVVVGLHLDELGPDAVRLTNDVDCVVLTASLKQHAELEAELRRRGLRQPLDEPGPICRWRTPAGTLVDVMPRDPAILGFGSRWYELAHDLADTHVSEGVRFRVVNPSLLFAMKVEAFLARGQQDPWASRDLEDLVSLLAGCSRLEKTVETSPPQLRHSVAAFCAALLTDERTPEWIAGHAPRGAGRASRALTRLHALAGLQA